MLAAQTMEFQEEPNGFEVLSDNHRHPFCDTSTDLLHLIARVSSTAIYQRKTTLFVEGQKAHGVFILVTGKAKLFTGSSLGKIIITRLAGSGEVLGLSAVVSRHAYRATAEMVSEGQVDFIPRDSMLRLIKEHPQIAVAVAEKLSANYYSLHDTLRSLGLATHPMERLAKLLLSWTNAGDQGTTMTDHAFKLPLTHQEIADSIGSTRQTVSKLFAELRRNRLLRAKGQELAIVNRPELEQIVQF